MQSIGDHTEKIKMENVLCQKHKYQNTFIEKNNNNPSTSNITTTI